MHTEWQGVTESLFPDCGLVTVKENIKGQKRGKSLKVCESWSLAFQRNARLQLNLLGALAHQENNIKPVLPWSSGSLRPHKEVSRFYQPQTGPLAFLVSEHFVHNVPQTLLQFYLKEFRGISKWGKHFPLGVWNVGGKWRWLPGPVRTWRDESWSWRRWQWDFPKGPSKICLLAKIRNKGSESNWVKRASFYNLEFKGFHHLNALLANETDNIRQHTHLFV